MKFLIVGPNQEKSGKWGGYKFKDGACEVPQVQATDVENARRILSRFYSAFPDVELTKLKDGTLVRTCDVPEANLKNIAPPPEPVLGDDVEVHSLVGADSPVNFPIVVPLDGILAVKLIEAGYSTVGELRVTSDTDLEKIKGIGKKTVKDIRALIGE